MAGLEVLETASAAAALLETAIDLSTVLDSHANELAHTKAIVQLIREEGALRTAGVASELVEVEAIGARLVACLQNLEPENKGPMRQLTHQLLYGSKDEQTLTDVMDELTRAKTNLSLRLKVANVGLARTVDNTIVANTAVVDRINDLLEQVFGEGRGLKIAEVLKNRSPRGDGTVPLSDIDISSLREEWISSTGNISTAASTLATGNTATSRIVVDNLTKDQALQINGPVGEKGWWEVSHLEIKNNVAGGNSIQLNVGTSIDAFDRILAARAATMLR